MGKKRSAAKSQSNKSVPTHPTEAKVSILLKIERPDGTSVLTIEPPEQITSSTRYRNLMRYTAILLLGQALIDGEVRAIELNRINQLIYRLYRVPKNEIDTITKEALYSYHELGVLAIDNSASVLHRLLSRSQKESILHHMVEIADSDGVIDNTEHALLKHVGSILKVNLPLRGRVGRA
jgi:uncharacterized tellurite resistance protein B-like protein